ncbi:MAG: GTPase [Chloroflexota bacterium]|nr:GTPase [Chloroflexota bacterium]
MEIAERVLQGDRLALARLLTALENDQPQGRAALDALFPHTGKAHIVGVTGPSGSGKSSLVNRLALQLAQAQAGRSAPRVAVLAVDPSSPFSGGALLGDRVRMRDLMEQPHIFIRSMASRGALGGLARAAGELVLALEAAGFERILVETVGAGQSEVDIARLAHTTLVVEAPGLGDDIQAAKAGILEIADVLVVNKSDKSGADTAAHALAAMLEISAELKADAPDQPNMWKVPVCLTSALNREGISELADAIAAHHDWLKASGEWQRRADARLEDLFNRLLRERLLAEWQRSRPQTDLQAALQALRARKTSPYSLIERLFS